MGKGKEKDNLDSKEEKVLRTSISIGVMLGIVVGMLLSFTYGNFIF